MMPHEPHAEWILGFPANDLYASVFKMSAREFSEWLDKDKWFVHLKYNNRATLALCKVLRDCSIELRRRASKEPYKFREEKELLGDMQAENWERWQIEVCRVVNKITCDPVRKCCHWESWGAINKVTDFAFKVAMIAQVFGFHALPIAVSTCYAVNGAWEAYREWTKYCQALTQPEYVGYHPLHNQVR